MDESNKSHQNDELELLQSIFIDNFKIINTSPFLNYQIEITPDTNDSPLISIIFDVKYNDEYPSDSIFEYKIYDKNNEAVNSQFNQLYTDINLYFEENKGFPIVYQVTEMIKEFGNKLDTKLQIQSKQFKNDKKIALNNVSLNSKNTNNNNSLLEKNNLIETRKFTLVTKESYMSWFQKFNKENNKKNEKSKEYKLRSEINKRQSGREYFMDISKENNNILELEKLEIDNEGEDVDYNTYKELKSKESKTNKLDSNVIDEDLFDEEDLDIDDIDFEN